MVCAATASATECRSTPRGANLAEAISGLELLRRVELDNVRPWLRSGLRVLEIGGGTGYQASLLADIGCEVLSIDLPRRASSLQSRFHPVVEYDGRRLPVPDKSVDCVFSSNVLEHVHDLPEMLGEIRRVLKPGGLAIHILPSATWRLWTSLAYFGYVFAVLVGKRVPYCDRVSGAHAGGVEGGVLRALVRFLLAPLRAHGAYANAIVELYCFSRRRWMRVFREQGFRLIALRSNRLFYTGFVLFPRMSAGTRANMARWLGSSCHIYVSEPSR